ncbi:MAG: carbonic anhydrase [Deltaproteobacteria bacterium RBG_13_58_19]|nr:MAG: carbonic anhydrase [Deltaproteobacteria bacterium RBG_13_58_19]
MAAEKTTVTADQALKFLEDGNKRFVAARFDNAKKSDARRAEVAKGQKPFAVIIGCSDSRVPPEVVFDQGLGDLFIVRLAGNIVDDAALGSIEYAVDHLGAPLIVILGHQRCGAVEATVQGGEAHGHIPILLKAIQPAVDQAKGRPGDLLDNAIRANVALVAAKLKGAAPILAPAVQEGKVKVVGAYYDLDTGKVSLLPG